jgi:thymidylate kinase
MERLFDLFCKGTDHTDGRGVMITSQPGATTDGLRMIERSKALGIELGIDDYIRDRAYHAPLIEERLHLGDIVLCGRYTASTVAYQGDLNPYRIGYIRSENDRVTHGLVPDLAVFLLISPSDALRRLQERNRPGDDSFTVDQLHTIDCGYGREIDHCLSQGQKWLIVSAHLSEEEISDRILAAVKELIQSKSNALP